MNTPQDGGPAFPVPATHNPDGTVWYHAQEGMSLRDWFAGMALQGILSNHTLLKAYDKDAPNVPTRHVAAKQAYGIADAMLAARKEDAQ